MTWQNAFRVIIRVIFIFAYIAFLAASIRHVATFFHNFEADPSDWVNPYTLAVSIDLTSLVLTVGVMFFRKNMPWYAQLFTWVFIVALTAFSWFVNWEYAMTYQGSALKTNGTLSTLNPILASSFAFLNLAYSVVAEFFSSKTETAAELAAKVDELEQLEEQQLRLAAYRERTKQPSVIQRVKNTALEAKEAAKEVLKAEEPVSSPELDPVSPVVSQPVPQNETEDETEQETIQEPITDPLVSSPVSNPSRITVKLDETTNETDAKLRRNTDDLTPVAESLPEVSAPVSSPGNKKKTIPDTEPVRIMRRALKRNPNIKPDKLAEKAKVTETYARQMAKLILAEAK